MYSRVVGCLRRHGGTPKGSDLLRGEVAVVVDHRVAQESARGRTRGEAFVGGPQGRGQCGGAVAHVLSGDKDLTRRLGMRADRRFPVVHGGVDCRLLRYEVRGGPRPTGDASGRAGSMTLWQPSPREKVPHPDPPKGKYKPKMLNSCLLLNIVSHNTTSFYISL